LPEPKCEILPSSLLAQSDVEFIVPILIFGLGFVWMGRLKLNSAMLFDFRLSPIIYDPNHPKLIEQIQID